LISLGEREREREREREVLIVRYFVYRLLNFAVLVSDFKDVCVRVAEAAVA
jgi:hypothetical protein